MTDRDMTALRIEMVARDPELMEGIMRGGAFGNQWSTAVAGNMLNRHHGRAIDDANAMTSIEEVTERTWLVRMPFVNSVVFETDDGLVLVDTGMAPAGPALLAAIRSVTQEPIHTIVYTHAHIDHAYGTWALIAEGAEPEIIAHRATLFRFGRYWRLRNSAAKYHAQNPASMPTGEDDWVAPTRLFDDRLSIEVGGERFDIVHRRGETDDHCYVSAPDRKAVACGDFYQGFLPNAGNGKRVQRYVEDWALAMREMAALEPEHLLPAHGDVQSDPAAIQEALITHAEALEHLAQYTIDGLNSGLRQDEVAAGADLPEALKNHPTLNEQYVSPRDISRMVIKQYCGWWDDIPSHWDPATFDRQAAEIAEMAGGVEALATRSATYLPDDIQMACHLADWAWYADPSNVAAAKAVMAAYRARLIAGANTQEGVEYLGHMANAYAVVGGFQDDAD